ncbi:MAG: hypothetical protein E7432_09725 [Ruminococcaceae bacterium]|nr:hypothetical protein [Oscillospiraceae bacterium]
MPLLPKAEFNRILEEYYLEHYGKDENDIWMEKPAVNVVTFRRGDRFISLKSHIITGEVEEIIEEIKK